MTDESFDVRLARLEEKMDMILDKLSGSVALENRLREAENKLITIMAQSAQIEKDYQNNLDKMKFYGTVIALILALIEFYLKFGLQ